MTDGLSFWQNSADWLGFLWRVEVGPIKFIPTVLISVALVGCAGVSGPVKAPEEVVRERANARWQALVGGDLEKAYSYLSPATREIKSLERYESSVYGVGRWKGASVTEVKCDPQRCEAVVEVRSLIYMRRAGMMETKGAVNETWLYDEKTRNWWFVPK